MSRTATLELRTATHGDVTAVTNAVVGALASGPVAEWLFPDATRRLAISIQCGSDLLDHAVAHGLVDIVGANIGAAVWYPVTADGNTPPGVYQTAAGTVAAFGGPDAVDRVEQLNTIVTDCVPAAPYHYLAWMGVYPGVQGCVFGTALLDHHHDLLDTIGVGAYLVATSHRAKDLFSRHGYTTRHRRTLPDGPALWAMWRNPRTRRGGR